MWDEVGRKKVREGGMTVIKGSKVGKGYCWRVGSE